MAQMVMIDEDELNLLKSKERRFEDFDIIFEIIKKIEKECYPDVPYLLEYDDCLEVLYRLKKDVSEYRKPIIRKYNKKERRKRKNEKGKD